MRIQWGLIKGGNQNMVLSNVWVAKILITVPLSSFVCPHFHCAWRRCQYSIDETTRLCTKEEWAAKASKAGKEHLARVAQSQAKAKAKKEQKKAAEEAAAAEAAKEKAEDAAYQARLKEQHKRRTEENKKNKKKPERAQAYKADKKMEKRERVCVRSPRTLRWGRPTTKN